jgi:hypothetical protein
MAANRQFCMNINKRLGSLTYVVILASSYHYWRNPSAIPIRDPY